MTNDEIAGTLEAYAALLDLAGAGHYTVRAYRRGAELIRETRAPVADLVRAGRARELRGGRLGGEPPPLVELAAVRGDLHCHTTWSDGKASVDEMAVAARELGYD